MQNNIWEDELVQRAIQLSLREKDEPVRRKKPDKYPKGTLNVDHFLVKFLWDHQIKPEWGKHSTWELIWKMCKISRAMRSEVYDKIDTLESSFETKFCQKVIPRMPHFKYIRSPVPKGNIALPNYYFVHELETGALYNLVSGFSRGYIRSQYVGQYDEFMRISYAKPVYINHSSFPFTYVDLLLEVNDE